MSELLASPRRRLFLGTAAAALASPALAGLAAPVVLRVLAMSDLHSAYERTSQLLAALEAEIARPEMEETRPRMASGV